MNLIESYIDTLLSDGVSVDAVQAPSRYLGLSVPASVSLTENKDGTGQVVYLRSGVVVARQVPTE